MKNMLQDKVVLITGSSRKKGIGAATARLAKAYGAMIILHGKTASEELKKIAHELESEYILCDVADKEAVSENVGKIVKKYGRIDVLINNAGYAKPAGLLESDDGLWIKHYEVNVLGTIHFCQEIIPLMQKQKYGRIVNVASLSGVPEYSKTRTIAYAASKAAIFSITGALAREYAPHIAVNAVLPGGVETDMSKTWSSEVREMFNNCLVGRPAQPKEIAEVILFLASDRASYMTAQNIIIDGGLLAGKFTPKV